MNQLMTRHSVRTIERPLTDEQLHKAAPSIFATQPWHQMSQKYAFIPTIEVVNAFREQGLMPVQAAQSVTRVPGKSDFTKHQIRFRDYRHGDQPLDLDLKLGKIYTELALTNSHDGASAYKMDAALFRLICLNGLMVPEGLVGQINVKHTGNPGDVISITHEILEQFPKVQDSVQSFSRKMLNAPEATAYANAALALRYDEGEAPISAEQLLTPVREADREPNLWNVFNTVQEKLTSGGEKYRTSSGRRVRTKGVKGIAENARLNKALWTLAEELRRLRS